MASRFRFPAADAGTETEDEERRRGVEGVAGSHEARARLEGVHQAPSLLGRALVPIADDRAFLVVVVDAEDGPSRDAGIHIRRPVERVKHLGYSLEI